MENGIKCTTVYARDNMTRGFRWIQAVPNIKNTGWLPYYKNV